MLEDVYQTIPDTDGNFLEQFQTTGFDARYFELYLWAYFDRTGLNPERPKGNPDFIVSRKNTRVAVEATTVNPTNLASLKHEEPDITNLTAEALRVYQDGELAIKFGSPLYSKLQKRYWESSSCKGLPLVIAIEAFHNEYALGFSDSALAKYLYGLDQTAWTWSPKGELATATKRVEKHQSGDKEIPSNFFSLPDAENISAVLFTNSGTHAKFQRMGYQHGYFDDHLEIYRSGFAYTPHPDAADPTLFSYNLASPPLVEPWGQGMVVHHNPRAIRPIPRRFFPGASDMFVKKGQLRAIHDGWHPFSSLTWTTYLENTDVVRFRHSPVAVGPIPKTEFQAISGYYVPHENPFIEEHGWFSDDSNSFLGVLGRDRTDNDWGYAVLARDEYFRFRAIETEVSIPERNAARYRLQATIQRLAQTGKRLFGSGSARKVEAGPVAGHARVK